jgi:hypothetical protein
MAYIEEALRTYLLTQTSLTALIGDKIYPGRPDQNATMPYIVLIDISNVFDHTHEGQSSLESPVKQLTIYSTVKAQSMAIAGFVKTAIRDFSGTLSGLLIHWIKLMNEFSTVENIAEGIDAYIVDIEFEINYYKT